ncbi:hypothetical protein [Actinoplanes sp. URMC 104]|uniref:hypothetical protein n=1 Tax=Actinoplanes sp. URMC 104 TaxID=3423409 RepID=UPI003F19FD4B
MTTTLFDRVIQWNLDRDGDMYGDERERFRWYEGMSAAASMQWLAVPWAAVVLVWTLGRSSVIPLAVVLVALMIPMLLCTAYVRRRQVETLPRFWSAKRVFWGLIGGIPYAVFMVGALHAYDPQGSTWKGAALGTVLGGAISLGIQVATSRRRRRLEALAVDED